MHYRSLADVARLIAARELSSASLTRQMLDRIAVVDGQLQSYVTVMTDRAIASAERADAEIRAGRYRGPLHGVPIAVKDLCNTRGVRMMSGTKVLATFVPDFDATVVARLEQAGDPTRWSGVSSSGSGVATAAGLCFASVGTDTGGSIRYPSAANTAQLSTVRAFDPCSSMASELPGPLWRRPPRFVRNSPRHSSAC